MLQRHFQPTPPHHQQKQEQQQQPVNRGHQRRHAKPSLSQVVAAHSSWRSHSEEALLPLHFQPPPRHHQQQNQQQRKPVNRGNQRRHKKPSLSKVGAVHSSWRSHSKEAMLQLHFRPQPPHHHRQQEEEEEDPLARPLK